MIYLYAFLFGGVVCLIGEALIHIFKFTPGFITTLFVSIGAFLELFNIYDFFIEKCGAGASLQILSFGHSLAHGAYEGLINQGFLGLFQEMFKNVSAGISFVIILSVLIALFFKPKG